MKSPAWNPRRFAAHEEDGIIRSIMVRTSLIDFRLSINESFILMISRGMPIFGHGAVLECDAMEVLLNAFVVLFIVIDPVGLAPMFIALTPDATPT